MAAPSLEVLVFEVGGQRYGLPASDVREIQRAATLTPLPRAPTVVEGVVNLRGTVVPILDIRARFRLPARPIAHTDHFVFAQAGERLVALRVDRAIDLVRVDAADVEDARTALPGVEYVAWVAKLPHSLILIHDLRTFLSRAEATELDERVASGEWRVASEGPKDKSSDSVPSSSLATRHTPLATPPVE